MATITLSSKHQVTLPVEMVRSLGLKAGDRLVAELIDNRIVLLPQPESWADYFSGSMKGVYGSTKEEVDRYIAEVRYGWDIDSLKDALELDPELRAVYGAVSSGEARRVSVIREASGVPYAAGKLKQLEDLHAIRQSSDSPQNEDEPSYERSS
jgi:antitoxin ChpS